MKYLEEQSAEPDCLTSNLKCGLRLMISSKPLNFASLSEEVLDQGSH